MRTSTPIKILMLGPSLTAVGGVSTHLNQLFASPLARRFQLLLFQVGSEGRYEGPVLKALRLTTGPLQFAYRLLRDRPDIVHFNTSLVPKSFWRDFVFMLVAHYLFRKKIVFQKHGGALPQQFFAHSALLTRLLRQVLRLPRAIVVLGSEERSAYDSFVPGQNVVLIPNAIDVTGLVERPLEHAPTGPLHLAYLGRIADYKGVFTIVDALAKVVQDGRDMHLTVAGSGPAAARLEARVQELGLTGRVRFAGPLHGADIKALWRTVDVFVFPTWHKEGLPYALLEAMAAGAVPVTTRVGAIPDVMQDGVHGLFVPPRDPQALAQALARLDGDRAALLAMAQAGRARVLEHYTVQRLVADFERLYESMGADQGGRDRCAASPAS